MIQRYKSTSIVDRSDVKLFNLFTRPIRFSKKFQTRRNIRILIKAIDPD